MSKLFLNEAPITCPWTILDLAYARWQDGTERTVIRRSKMRNADGGWTKASFVEVRHFYKRGDFACADCILVDDEVLAALIAVDRLIGEPFWGGRSERVFIVTSCGENDLWLKREVVGMSYEMSALEWLKS